MSDPSRPQRVTLRILRDRVRQGRPFPMLTCYDAITAGWLVRGGVAALLVGDTAAQFVLGHDSTLPATMRFMLEITAAVRRGAPQAFVMADMPFGSYQGGHDRAVRNAVRFLARGGADVVKLEVDASFAPLVERLTHAGVPVVAHLGSRPQHKRLHGGRSRTVYHSEGEIDQAVETAKLMVQSGAVMLLFEAVPAELPRRVIEAIGGLSDEPVVVIGCGAGPHCHGHVIVLHDLLGLSSWQPPFAPPMAAVGEQVRAAAAAWADQIASGRYLRENHPYNIER